MADRLGPINASQFVGNNPIVVEPRAVQALTEAFRSGQIRADEIADRMMVQPAKQAAAKMAADPVVVEAKRQELLNQSASSGVDLQSKQLALKNAQQQAQIPPIIQQKNAELAQKGMQVFPETGGEWTSAKSDEVDALWKDLKHWEAEFASAQSQAGSVKSEDITHPDQSVEKISYQELTKRKVDSNRAIALQTWQDVNKSPLQWVRGGRQPAPTLFGPAPGEVTAVPPEILSGAEAPGFDAQPTPLPGAVPATTPTPSTGLVIKPGGMQADKKAPTEMQAKAASAVARMISTDEVLGNLSQQGFDPGQFRNWVQDYMVGPFEALKTADKKTYDAAASGWIQGLLRLESGAAISHKEQAWYEKTFFPQKGDNASVQAVKSEMRSDMEAIVEELARGGNLDVPALLAVRKRGEVLEAASGAGSSGAVEQTTIGGKNYRIDRSGGQVKLIPMTSATTPTVQPYVQPDRLGGSDKIKVEPKKEATGPGRRF